MFVLFRHFVPELKTQHTTNLSKAHFKLRTIIHFFGNYWLLKSGYRFLLAFIKAYQTLLYIMSIVHTSERCLTCYSEYLLIGLLIFLPVSVNERHYYNASVGKRHGWK